MVLFKYDKEPLEGCKTVYMYAGQVDKLLSTLAFQSVNLVLFVRFLFQETLQKILLILAVLSVPVLLLGKPILFKMNSNKQKNHAVSGKSRLDFDSFDSTRVLNTFVGSSQSERWPGRRRCGECRRSG